MKKRKVKNIKAKKGEKPEIQNLVSKHLNEFNKPKTFIDRKKEAKKRGYDKGGKNLPYSFHQMSRPI